MRLIAWVLALALAVAFFAAAGLVLQSCALVLPWGGKIGWCTGTSARAAPNPPSRTAVDLQREIRFLERQLASRQCPMPEPVPQPVPPAPDPVVAPPAPPPIEPEAEPQPIEPAAAPQVEAPAEPAQANAPRPNGPIDEQAWGDQDLAAMQGCWDLDSDYRSQDIVTGEVTQYDVWNMCFDDQGRGFQALQGTNGQACNAPVTGAFDASGAFVISDPDNVPCSDNGYLFRREITCQRNPDGTASCVSIQPERGENSRADVQLRPAR